MMGKNLKEVIHETAKDLHKAGVMSEQTMREFDVLCLPPLKHYTPLQIKRLRKHNHASQAVFAAYLNTTPSTVQKWEQGQKHPGGLALKLLNLVDRHGLAHLAA
jgi:putative transcriptional regulator